MIKYFYKSLRSQQVQELSEYKRGCWVYVEAPSPEEVEYLTGRFKLDPGHISDSLDEDEMPRLEKEDDQTYIFVRYAYKNAEAELVTVPLLFVFSDDIVITISLVHLPQLEKFLRGKVQFATTQRAKLVLQILHQIVEQYDAYINSTSKQIKLIRSRLRGHEISNQDFIDFVLIEDELNEFLAALMPTNATLRRLLRGRYIPLFEEDQDIIEDLLLNNEQSIEACNSNIKSIVNIREAYSSISSNNLNRTIKRLTIATVMIMLPSMFFSLYGMNVQLPGQEYLYAFPIVVGGSFLLTLTVFAVARRKRFF
ncbi:MAG TPA: magnesium transporter CorA family protein [Candidatus Saccharimonadales bacterium]|nr:magnesium transporter CorA family protein [Candidatus Saccharimonadales bacterium]